MYWGLDSCACVNKSYEKEYCKWWDIIIVGECIFRAYVGQIEIMGSIFVRFIIKINKWIFILQEDGEIASLNASFSWLI